MIVKKQLLVLFTSFLLWGTPSLAQTDEIFIDTPVGEASICAWSKVGLREYPSESSRTLATIFFTEELSHLGREAFVRSERNNYVFVEAEDGTKGWINDMYLVKGGGTVVVLKNSPIYQKLNTPQSVTQKFFRAGEIAILTEFTDGWVKLTSHKKGKSGWVEGYDALSVEEYDIEAAALLAEASAENDIKRRRDEILAIRDGRSYVSNEMRQVLDEAINRTYGRPSVPKEEDPAYYVDDIPYYANGEDAMATNASSYNRPSESTGAVPGFRGDVYSITEKEVVDMQTGRSYIRVIETGTIQPVKAKRPANIYYAYHKTLPKGSKILLEVPGTGKYVQLEVIAPLKSTNQHMIGLGPEIIKSVFGQTQAKNVPSATISYPKYAQ